MTAQIFESSLRRWQGLALGLALVCLLFVAYGTVLTRGPFGINDDYQILYRTHERIFDPMHNEIMGMGRPVDAWSYEISYGLCEGKVARLVWMRAGAVVGIGLLAWTMFFVLRGLRYGVGFAATVAALLALTPACGVYAGYASGVVVPYALVASLFAGKLLAGAGGWRRDFAAAVLIVTTCSTWQAAVPLAMFPVLAAAWRRTEDDGPTIPAPNARPWWQPWMVGGLAVVAYGLLCALMMRFATVSAGGLARLSVATDLRTKALFLVDILRSGVTSWARLQAGRWERVIGGITTGYCLAALVVWRDGRVRWTATCRRVGLAVFMILLSVAPLLAAREDNGAFRSLVCLYTVIIFLGVYGARQLARQRPDWAKGVFVLGVLALTAGAARYHVWHGLVEPNVREYVGLRDQVRRQFPDGPPAHLVYLAPTHTLLVDDRMTPSWEYGLISSTFWWVTRPFLVLIFAETSPQVPVKPTDLAISYREAGNPGVPVLDATPILLREPGEWRDDPRWGRVCAFRGGWLYSPWFGYFNVRYYPAVQHHLLGALWVTSAAKDGNDLWFFHPGLGQFYTKEGVYPHLLLIEPNHWVSVTDDNPSLLRSTDDQTGQTLPYPP